MKNLNSLVTYVENDNSNLNDEINYLDNYLLDIKAVLENKNQSLSENISELELLKSGDIYNLHDPTYNEVRNFILSDTTDEHEYISGIYDCKNFAKDVNNNAKNLGIRCCFVFLYFYDTDTGHVIVGYNTIDRGMVYVDPQNDEFVENLVVGNEYWTECVIPSGPYTYEDVPNDTIKEIIIFW